MNSNPSIKQNKITKEPKIDIKESNFFKSMEGDLENQLLPFEETVNSLRSQ